MTTLALPTYTENQAATSRDVPPADIALALQGDAAASRRIVERLHQPILATIHRFLGRRMKHEVEDVAQDVFLRVFRALDSFDPGRGVKFTTWVFSIVRNRCFDVLKKRQLNMISLADDEEGDDGAYQLADATAPTPLSAYLNTELGGQIDRALASLSPNHRMVFVLREFQGMDIRCIAEVMGSNEGTVKSRLHRARAALQQELAPYVRGS